MTAWRSGSGNGSDSSSGSGSGSGNGSVNGRAPAINEIAAGADTAHCTMGLAGNSFSLKLFAPLIQRSTGEGESLLKP